MLNNKESAGIFHRKAEKCFRKKLVCKRVVEYFHTFYVNYHGVTDVEFSKYLVQLRPDLLGQLACPQVPTMLSQRKPLFHHFHCICCRKFCQAPTFVGSVRAICTRGIGSTREAHPCCLSIR